MPTYETATLRLAYEIAGWESAQLALAYEIGLSADEVAGLRLAYEIVTSELTQYAPLTTPVGYMTQIVGNYYPYWTAPRYKVGGRTQRILNSLIGFSLSDLMVKIRRVRADNYLSTTDISEPSQLWAAPRPVARRDQERPYNLLANPSLSRVHPYRLGPWAWNAGFLTATGSFELMHGAGLFGYYATRLTADTDQVIVLQQRNENLVLRNSQELTATVWYAGMRPARSPALGGRTSGPRLQLSIEYNDGTTHTVDKFLRDDTDGGWVKDSVSLTLTNDSHAVEVAVICDDYNGEKVILDVGGVQLEQGLRSKPWTENTLDVGVLYLESPKATVTEDPGLGSITYNRQQRIQVQDRHSWVRLVDELPPDRSVVTTATTEVGVARTVFDACVDEIGLQYGVGWRISGNKVERYNVATTMDETWHSLDIWDLYADGSRNRVLSDPGDLGVTQTLEAITVAGEWVYVVVKEVYLGNTARVLKVCSPYVGWDAQRLEAIADVYLDDGTGTCNSIGLIDSRKDYLLMDVDSTDYIVELVWDRAASTMAGSTLLRNDPGSAKLVA